MISKTIFKRMNKEQKFIYHVGCEGKIYRVYPVFILPGGFVKYKKKSSEVAFGMIIIIENAVVSVPATQLFTTLKAAERFVIKKEDEAKKWIIVDKPNTI